MFTQVASYTSSPGTRTNRNPPRPVTSVTNLVRFALVTVNPRAHQQFCTLAAPVPRLFVSKPRLANSSCDGRKPARATTNNYNHVLSFFASFCRNPDRLANSPTHPSTLVQIDFEGKFEAERLSRLEREGRILKQLADHEQEVATDFETERVRKREAGRKKKQKREKKTFFFFFTPVSFFFVFLQSYPCLPYVSTNVRTNVRTYACIYVCMHACMYSFRSGTLAGNGNRF